MTEHLGYYHRQRGFIGPLLFVVAAVETAALAFLRGQPGMQWLLGGLAALFAALGFCFQWLDVQGDAEALRVRFGPLPLFGARIPYVRITAAEPGRTSWIDGWGIHYLPGRGTTYNIAGFACVRLTVNGATVRIGTDDAEALAAFLRGRLGRAEPGQLQPH